jgi:putative FmdB family regulatory protein
MPLYEFRCRACGEVYEELLPAGDSPAASCPACADGEPVRLFSRFSARTQDARRADFSRVPFASACGCGGGCAHAHHRR